MTIIGYNRLGAHINCEAPGANRQTIADFACDLKAPGHVLLNDYKNNYDYSWQLYRRSPGSVRVHRRSFPVDPHNAGAGGWDGNINEADEITDTYKGKLREETMVNTFLTMQRDHKAPPGTLETLFCEPDMHGERLKARLKWELNCMKIANANGLGLCVGNEQQYVIEQPEVDAGFYDDELIYMSQHRQNIRATHAYWLGAPFLNIADALITLLTTPGAVQDSLWLVEDEVQRAAQRARYVAVWQQSHMIKGVMRLIRRCKDVLKIAPPRFAQTEVGVEMVRIPKSGAITNTVMALNGGVEPTGFPRMGTYWSKMHPGWSRAKSYMTHLKYYDTVELPEIEFMAMFALDTQFENGDYHYEDEELFRLLLDYAKTKNKPPVVTLPPSIPDEMTLEERVERLESDVKTLQDQISRIIGG